MAKSTSIKDAIKLFEATSGQKASEAEKVDLYGQIPPIEKMDTTLETLKACRHLALSTNNIKNIACTKGLDSITTLSLSRNMITKIENMNDIADTLEQLWLSYNQVEKLSGVERLEHLRVLFLSNNKIESIEELNRLQGLPHLEELLLVGNPLYNTYTDPQTLGSQWRIDVLKILPKLKKLDGVPVEPEEREAAQAATDSAAD